MHLAKKYFYAAGLIGMLCVPAAFAEPGAIPGGQSDVGRGHNDYIMKTNKDTDYPITIIHGYFPSFNNGPTNKINIADPKADYTLQINTNWSGRDLRFKFKSKACPDRAAFGCQVREELVYDTNYQPPGQLKTPYNGKSGIYIRYWIKSYSDKISFHDSECKNGWVAFKGMCFMDSTVNDKKYNSRFVQTPKDVLNRLLDERAHRFATVV